MRYLIDTNVFSEPVKPSPNRKVLRWAESQPREALAISTLSLGEVRKGLDLLAHGGRRAALERWLTLAIREQFRGRVLQVVDGLLLATAAVHGLTIVTRNEEDFLDRGVPVLNPWHATE